MVCKRLKLCRHLVSNLHPLYAAGDGSRVVNYDWVAIKHSCVIDTLIFILLLHFFLNFCINQLYLLSALICNLSLHKMLAPINPVEEVFAN